MDEVMKDEPIQIKGRIYSESTTYASCKSAPSKKVFKTLLGLAEEASTVREAVAKWSEGHPLGPKLSGMQSAEVVVFLMGLTQKFIQEQRQNPSSDKSFPTHSDKGHEVVLDVLKSTANNGSGAGLYKGSKEFAELDMDDDLLETFSSFPSK